LSVTVAVRGYDAREATAVRILRLILVVAAGVMVVAQQLQERHRLKVIERLPGLRARDYYETTRERDERLMMAVTGLLALAAVAALVVVATLGRAP
jgi:hypothetical protein